jgi:hypothetical protein
LLLFIKCLEINCICFVVNSLTKPDCPVLTVLSAVSFVKFQNHLFTPPLGDIKGLSLTGTLMSL